MTTGKKGMRSRPLDSSERRFTVEAVCVSGKKGVQKHPVESVRLIAGHGIEGDAHADGGQRQVSFLAAEDIESLEMEGLHLENGAFGENIITRGIDWAGTEVGGRISIGEAEMEITKIGKECHTPCVIFYAAGRCIMPERGVFARVLKGGIVHAQDRGHYRVRQGVQGKLPG